MRTGARTGRSRLLLVVLLAVLGLGAAVAPAAANGYPAPRQPVLTGTVKTAPSIQDELRDWLRLSGAARHTHATAPPDTWSAVCPQNPGEHGSRGRLSARESGAAGMAGPTTTSRSSRAPPRA
ncbi:hypothetical protein [Actinophytocola algeriensis]|uniref:Uncharacterized protein n=1 Tax=Actinophytocola algeriensis TaxID=1768010 RepID=A0A7W7Q1C4_9PSEU|nr:hypothetical protein [Actinophytocola algeriensis]MBB4905137.1 hypothetical protein [Actinophytocola algeriensis]MBE1473178.1 hypothetical protein [Actinophytocola algeriensis]